MHGKRKEQNQKLSIFLELGEVSEEYLKPCQTSMMERFCV